MTRRLTWRIGTYRRARRWHIIKVAGYVFFRFGRSCISVRLT